MRTLNGVEIYKGHSMYEIGTEITENCNREWDKVDKNKQHCRYICDGICENIYCKWNTQLKRR